MRSSSLFSKFIYVAFAVVVGLPVVAHASGDAAAGKAKALACAACHIAVAPSGDTPHLVGQRESYLAKQLKEFKSGDRKNAFMSAIAAQLSDPDIANLAAYWSSLPAGSDTVVPDEVAPIKNTHMAFPQGFPNGFVLYVASNDAGENTINKSYINTVGFQAAKANKPLPDGTVVVVVHESPKLGPDKKPIVAKDRTWVSDKVTSYAVMETRTGWGKDIPDLLRNEDWNYALFTPEKKLQQVNQAVCLACHKPQAAVGFVFTFKELQLKAHAK
jgi:cytochrome c553